MAEQTLRALLKIQPTHRGGLNLLGKVLVEQKRVKAAKECFEKLVQVYPEEAGGYYNLGCAALLLEEASLAIPYFTSYLRIVYTNREGLNKAFEPIKYPLFKSCLITFCYVRQLYRLFRNDLHTNSKKY